MMYDNYQNERNQPTWNPMNNRYEFQTPDGILCVDGDLFSEQERQGVDDLNEYSTWENCIDGETVYYA